MALLPRPAVGPAAPWPVPAPEVSTLPNGLTLWLYDLPGQYVIAAGLVLDLPLTAEPRELEGIAALAAAGLAEGTLDRPGLAFAADLEAVGAELNAWTVTSGLVAESGVPKQWFREGFTLFAEAILTPAYAAGDVERLAARRLQELARFRAGSRRLASHLAIRNLVGPLHRAGRLAGGTRATVAAIGADDVRAYHARHFTPERATLIVAGDLGGLGAAGLAAEAFGGWEPTGVPAAHAPVPLDPAPADRLYHRPGAVQADIRIGWPGLDRTDPRWAAFEVACAILGGGQASRLNESLREDHGWTYDVSLHSGSWRQGGYTLLATSTQTQLAAEVWAEARAITAGPRFTAQEVADAAGLLTRSRRLAWSTAGQVAGHAQSLALHGLPPTLPEDLDRAIAEVTPQTATAAWQEVAAGHRPVTVILGDADDLVGRLELEAEPVPEF